MSLSQIDIDNLLNDSFKSEETKQSEPIINYELLLFTDGAHERVKKRSTFGIYIQCRNKNSPIYYLNDTKIIKKIDKDTLIYNFNNNTLHYHNIFKNDVFKQCKFNNCNNFGIYTYNKNDIGTFCKIHKDESMIQTMTFINYDPTNIRAEGLAIVYALMYLKFVLVDNISKDVLVNHFNTFQFDNNKLEFQEYIIPLDTTNYTFYQIVTDSEFWINVITNWGNNWIKQNKILEKKNVDIIFYINILLTTLLNNNIIIHFKFVRGHSDKKNKDQKYTIYQKGNIIADKLANIAKDNINTNVKISFN